MEGTEHAVGDLIAGRFQVCAPLGGTSLVRSLRCAEAGTGRAWVVKVFAPGALSAAALARLEHDVAALAALDGAGDAPLLVAEGGGWVLARPWVPGDPLGGGRRPVREVLALGLAALERLERLHSAGVLHRDLKPSNLIRDGAGGVKLVDVGVVRPASARLDELPLEAALYAAPEQAGLLDRGVDARTDLYALGLVLFEALTGRPPFSGDSIAELLRRQLASRPPPLRDLAPEAPEALAQVVERLLRKDPRDRYQTAAGVRADLEALAASLDRGIAEPELIVGARDARGALTEPAFIGREAELASLEQALAEARGGRGGLIRLEAESGGGKSWLLDELARRAAQRGAWVLRGRGVDQVAQRPFQVFAGVAHEVVAAATAQPARRAALVERMGAEGPAAAAAMPELGAVFGDGAGSLGPEAHGEERSLRALAALIEALGGPDEPALVLVDDAQWADEPSVRLIERWLAGAPEGRWVVVVVAYRPEEVPEEHLLRTLAPSATLRLAPFGEDDVRRQIASMAGRLPDAAVEAVLRGAGGSPLLVTSLLYGLVEGGALTPGADGWRFDAAALAAGSPPLADLVTRRVTRLREPAHRLLSIGAVLGRTFDPALAATLAGLEPSRAVQALEESRAGLLWSDASGESYTFTHDKIREALLAALSDAERRELHLRAAEHLAQSNDRQRAFDVAYHFDAAGDPARALPHALEAAAQARARFALELAERQYRIALRGAGEAPRATRFAVAMGLGEVLGLRTRFDEAAAFFEQALGLAESAQARAEVEERRGQLELKRGDLREACRHAEAALRHAGRWVPRSTFTCTLLCLWEVLVQVLHTWLPRLFVGRRSLRGAERDLFAIRLYHSMNGPYFFARGAVWAMWAHLRDVNLCERYPPTVDLGRAYAAHGGPLAGFPGLWERGIRLTGKGAEMCAAFGDVWGQAQALTFRALVLHSASRLREAVETAREGVRLFDRTGDRWEADTGLCFVALSLFRLGDLQGALDVAKQLWRRGQELHDVHALAWALDVWARATDGQVPLALIGPEVERSRSGEHVQTAAIVMQAEGQRLLGAGRPAEAAAVLDEAAQRTRREAGFFHDLNAPLVVYLATALRVQAQSFAPASEAERQALLRRAERASQAAVKLARRFRNSLPQALRDAAHLAALRGDPLAARRLIDESVAVAERLEARYERALSAQARAQFGAVFGWPDATEEGAAAARELARLRPGLRAPQASVEPLTTLSIHDRFATVLRAGRRIATALAPEAIWTELRAAALALLRAERCLVILGDPAAPEAVAGDAGTPFSSALAVEAVRTGRALAESLGGSRDEDDLRRHGSRSVLCVPIFVRGQAAACLYVTHGEVSQLFGEEEVRIGEFLGTLAGAALENAQGFEAVQALSRELERRVEERTAELAQNLARLRETQEQLVQSGKMAAVGTLVAGLSHELNNPLAVVTGYTQALLRLPALDPALRKPLESIARQTERCTRLVRALLDFSRSKPVHREPVQARALLDAVCAVTSSQTRSRGIKLHLDLPEAPLPDVLASVQDIESALLNLMTNAIDATPRDGEITLGAETSVVGGKEGVLFRVRDSGSGMSPEIASRIFDPFFTTKPVGQGTGLGLSLTRQVVAEHGGTIEVETAEGQGTTMSLWLPAVGGAAS